MMKDDIQKKVNKLSKTYKKNREIPLKVITVMCVLIIGFFMSSNFIFDGESQAVVSIDLDKKISLDNVSISLNKRQFNPETGLVQLDLTIEKNSSYESISNYDFEVRENVSPDKLNSAKLIQTDDDRYVLITSVSKDWQALSVTVVNSERKIRFYCNKSDISKNTNLLELDQLNYKIENCNNDIEDIRKKIEEINADIDSKIEAIATIKEENNNIQNEKKYMTKKELATINSQLSSNDSQINSLNNQITKNQTEIKDLEEKIQKIQEKIQDLKK